MRIAFLVVWWIVAVFTAVAVVLFVYSTVQCLVVAHRLPVWPWEKFGCAEAAR